jgi:hypothetical protein
MSGDMFIMAPDHHMVTMTDGVAGTRTARTIGIEQTGSKDRMEMAAKAAISLIQPQRGANHSTCLRSYGSSFRADRERTTGHPSAGECILDA